MSYSLLSVIEICAGGNAGYEEERQAWRRRGYVWRKLGKVLPDGPPYTRGVGAAKRYEAAAIPLIGVMLCISKRFSSVEVLDEISQELQRRLSGNRAFLRCWSEALRIGEGRSKGTSAELQEIQLDEKNNVETVLTTPVFPSIWLTIAFEGPINKLSVRCGTGPSIKLGEDVDIYCVDLGFVFGEVWEEGCFVLGKGFRLASPPRRGRDP